jgi:hypothetical protein
MARKRKASPGQFFTWAHNVEGCLRNGSFVYQRPDGTLVQWMNGDNMGDIKSVPERMKQVPTELALDLLPRCCGGQGG